MWSALLQSSVMDTVITGELGNLWAEVNVCFCTFSAVCLMRARRACSSAGSGFTAGVRCVLANAGEKSDTHTTWLTVGHTEHLRWVNEQITCDERHWRPRMDGKSVSQSLHVSLMIRHPQTLLQVTWAELHSHEELDNWTTFIISSAVFNTVQLYQYHATSPSNSGVESQNCCHHSQTCS